MEIEPKLTELERRRDDAKDYEYFMTIVEKAISDSNGAGGAIQMSEMQKPTPSKLDKEKLLKLVGAAFGGCVGLGLASLSRWIFFWIGRFAVPRRSFAACGCR